MGLPWTFAPQDGERVHLDLLRPDDPADEAALYAMQSDPEVCRYLLYDPRTPEQVRNVLARDAAGTLLAETGDFVQPAIRDAEGRLIGTLYFKITSIEDSAAEIGWLLAPSAQGHGYAREAAALMLDLAFGELGLHRVHAELDPRNAASVALCTRLGMRHEAHFRENLWFKGAWADTGIYAVLADEWRS